MVSMGAADETGWLELSYDLFPRVEAAFHAVLEESLHPRGPEVLYDLVRDFGLPPGALAVDVGCGEGEHSLRLAERFQLTVIGLDPVRHGAGPRFRSLWQAGGAS